MKIGQKDGSDEDRICPTRKHYTPDYKAKVVLEILKEEQTLAQISAEYGVHPTQLGKWKAQVLEGLPRLFDDERKVERAR